MSKKNDFGDNVIAFILGGIVLLPFLIIYFIIKAIIAISKSGSIGSTKANRYKLVISEDDNELLTKIDNMEGHEFERFMTEVLKKNNFKNVYTTRGSGDYGADIIGELNGIRYAFQCKRFESKIGPKPIGEVLRGMNHYKCQKGVVITNNYFTKQAQKESMINNVELWGRDKVLSLCRFKRKQEEQEYKELTKRIDINRIDQNTSTNVNNTNNTSINMSNTSNINKTALAISIGVGVFVFFIVGIACMGDYAKGDNNNIANITNTTEEDTNNNNDNNNQENIEQNEPQTISYNNFTDEIRNYANSTVNNEMFDVEVRSSSVDDSPSITYYIKDTGLSKEEYDRLFKDEITKLYNAIKDKELIWNTVSGRKDCKNASILLSISYKNDKNVYSDSIGVESMKYSNDRWQGSYDEIMQKDVISNDRYKTMIKRRAK